MAQNTEHRIWKIVELFYKSFLAFRRIRDQYDERVARYRAEHDGALAPMEFLERFDFRKLEELRDRYLGALKDHCHILFRGRETTDLLDRSVSDIFHEVSLLKEEFYTVESYGPAAARGAGSSDLPPVVDESSRLFPQKVDRVDGLFAAARGRIELLLSGFRDHKILARSLFLNRHGFVSECYPAGIEGFYAIMYPERGVLAGYEKVGLSFLSSGFSQCALEAFEEGLAAARRAPEGAAPARGALVESLTASAACARAALERAVVADAPNGTRA